MSPPTLVEALAIHGGGCQRHEIGSRTGLDPGGIAAPAGQPAAGARRLQLSPRRRRGRNQSYLRRARPAGAEPWRRLATAGRHGRAGAAAPPAPEPPHAPVFLLPAWPPPAPSRPFRPPPPGPPPGAA